MKRSRGASTYRRLLHFSPYKTGLLVDTYLCTYMRRKTSSVQKSTTTVLYTSFKRIDSTKLNNSFKIIQDIFVTMAFKRFLTDQNFLKKIVILSVANVIKEIYSNMLLILPL